jgi:hypothetical protein
MKLANAAHITRPWPIHEITRDFRLEDVWALPTPGSREDFPRLVRWLASRDHPVRSSRSAAVRALWALRQPRWRPGGQGSTAGWRCVGVAS